MRSINFLLTYLLTNHDVLMCLPKQSLPTSNGKLC